MRKKLKKDLKILNTIIGKLIVTVIIDLVSLVLMNNANFREDEALTGFLVISIVVYVTLYFFNAWIVGDEEGNESSNVEK